MSHFGLGPLKSTRGTSWAHSPPAIRTDLYGADLCKLSNQLAMFVPMIRKR
jgi:hypothetical protein